MSGREAIDGAGCGASGQGSGIMSLSKKLSKYTPRTVQLGPDAPSG